MRKIREQLPIVGGLLIGVPVGQYAGLNLLIPMAAGFAFWRFAAKHSRGPAEAGMAAAVQAGHLGWYATGALFATPVPSALLLEMAFLAAAIAWLVKRPGLAAFAIIGGLQALSAAANAVAFAGAAFGSPDHRALLVHVILRLAAVGLLAMAALRATRSVAAAV
jgi:hypothetical protein